MDVAWKQFWRNMVIGIIYSAVWYYGFYYWFKGFWIPTILTNIIGFFLGRYFIFKEQKKCKGCENLSREFTKLMMLLMERFPDAWKYYEERLRPLKEDEK